MGGNYEERCRFCTAISTNFFLFLFLDYDKL